MTLYIHIAYNIKVYHNGLNAPPKDITDKYLSNINNNNRQTIRGMFHVYFKKDYHLKQRGMLINKIYLYQTDYFIGHFNPENETFPLNTIKTDCRTSSSSGNSNEETEIDIDDVGGVPNEEFYDIDNDQMIIHNQYGKQQQKYSKRRALICLLDYFGCGDGSGSNNPDIEGNENDDESDHIDEGGEGLGGNGGKIYEQKNHITKKTNHILWMLNVGFACVNVLLISTAIRLWIIFKGKEKGTGGGGK